ncbi:MAG: phosphate ABC transporter ATP-binding protein PstB [Actinobacteria bacterium]|nr:phosphate ABC transporter ATP-binding protein PstB [Actinomycetota bacterium]MCL5882987.1 phosphate ABC transporter ATP-binding protein PstB [Actinomycetota bacterium]
MAGSITTNNLSATFGEVRAIEGISIEIIANKVTALIGPSGCGKSTFLRCLNRMHELVPGAGTTGEVIWDGRNIYAPDVDATDVRRGIGMVFQKPNPFPLMSIADNVSAGLRLAGSKKNKGAIEEAVERSLRLAALWDEVKNKLHKPGGSLSGGQQQRLCIARALAVEPDIILMDEPCSALDPASTQKIEDTMDKLKDNYTIVIVTHNMQQAGRVSDFTGFLLTQESGEPGRLIEYGPTSKIFTMPDHKETENYITGRFG